MGEILKLNIQRAQLALSFTLALLLNALLTRFVDPSGTFGSLFIFPLWFSVGFWGRRGGLIMAALGVLLNTIVHLALGDGFAAWHHDPLRMASLLILETIAFVAVTLIVDKINTARIEILSTKLQKEHSQKLLSETEGKYQTLIDLAPESVVVTIDGKIVFANPRLSEMSGYKPEEFLGGYILDFVVAEDREIAAQRMSQRIEGKMLSPTSLRFKRKSGEPMWLEVVGRRVQWQGETGILYMLSNITDRKELELQLIQSQKMEAVGRLAGGIAHDFNNVLQVVLGYCEIARLKIDDREAVTKSITTIEAAAAKAGSLTQQLLAFSRRQVLKPETIELGTFLAEAVRILRPLLGEDVSVTLDAGEGELYATVDPGRLQQVIMNLAVNGRDAMPGGGWLRIAARRASCYDHSPCIAIEVTDTGLGIDESTLSHIFEPFFTTKENGKGTGLGLSIVKGIVEQSGGTVELESRQGIGTTVRIYLREAQRPTQGEGREPAPTKVDGAHAGILLVEDDEAVRSLIRDILVENGYVVHMARNGSEAVKLAHGDPTMRLLITDLVLSGMNGEQVAVEVLKERQNIEVLYITGYIEKTSSGNGSMSRVLTKPFSAADLLREVQGTLTRG